MGSTQSGRGFRRLLWGTAQRLAARGVTSDQVTSAGIVASGLGALAFGGSPLVRRLRGRARAGLRPHRRQHPGRAGRRGVRPALALGALAAAELASFVGVSARAAGGRRRYEGPMGKPDRMLVLGAAALAAAASRRPARVLNAGLALIAAGALPRRPTATATPTASSTLPAATATPLAGSTPPGPERCPTTRWPTRWSGRSPGGWA
jgi:hypothetical protein